MKNSAVLFYLFIGYFFTSNLAGQDTAFARKTIAKLCSDALHGRGYYKNGAQKAGKFIAHEMKITGLNKLPDTKGFFQSFKMTANVFYKAEITLGSATCFAARPLIAGRDFIVNANAGSQKALIKSLPFLNNNLLADSAKRVQLYKTILAYSDGLRPHYFLDTLSPSVRKTAKPVLDLLYRKCNTFEVVNNRAAWTVSDQSSPGFHVQIFRNPNDAGYCQSPHGINYNFVSKLQTSKQSNIVGFVPGKTKPDSFIFITAHYDHLGQLGPEAIYRGANDNACGVAMMLDLARYYSKNPAPYTIVFVAFAGEEAGLLGSEYFVKNPPVPLNKIRFLMNLDLVGTGETGGTVVNATVFKKDFQLLDSINKVNHYLPSLTRRGKAANSDHYFFTEAGVPSFFLYLSGPRPAYHDVTDVPETLTLAGYSNTFRLVRDFISGLK